ncbi:MAG: NAD(P)-dependent oxidoreductase [Dehalococcoidia bacterium]|nr:MAG: NAD(P)-dependent oxidoreductase [Dehalococcoidia bacterium]
MRILVTGGAGSVGSALVSSLLDRGLNVRVLDKTMGKLAELKKPNLEVFVAGIEDLEKVESAMKDVDAVYHLAESYSSQPREVFEIDVRGNINLLETAVKYNVRHFIFTSTTRVYGKPGYLPVDEGHPCNAEDSGRPLYAISKLFAEKLCLLYHREHNLPTTIFRFWWAYGPDIGGRALRTLIDTALKGGTIRVPDGTGGSFLHDDDTARAFELATLTEKAYGQVFNLSSGFFTSWHELAELACQLTNSSSKIELMPRDAWTGDASIGSDRDIPKIWDIGIGKAEQVLGYKPRYGPEEAKRLLSEAINKLVLTRQKVV